MDWQEAGLEAITSTIGGLDYGGWSPAGALVAIDPETGYIRTMVGGTDFKKQKFNLAWQARRQAGSAMKTFVLTSAVSMGMDPAKTYYVSHSPTIIPMGGAGAVGREHLRPRLGRAHTVTSATVRSDNSVYAQLCMDTGPENVVETAQKMGIASPLAAVPSITLGTEAVNPLEMAVAYATLASGGIYHPPQAIVKVVVPGGKVDWKPKTKGRRVLSAGVAYTVNKILQTNASSGTGAGTAAYVRGRGPARRAPPTTTSTPGTAGTRRTSRPRSGWATPDDYDHPDARGGRVDLLRAHVGQVQQGRARRPARARLRVRLHGLQAVEGQVLDDVAVALGEQR